MKKGNKTIEIFKSLVIITISSFLYAFTFNFFLRQIVLRWAVFPVSVRSHITIFRF